MIIRLEERKRKQEEIAQMVTLLRERRIVRETEMRDAPINLQYQEEMNARLRELAELARSGTLTTSLEF